MDNINAIQGGKKISGHHEIWENDHNYDLNVVVSYALQLQNTAKH